MSMICAEIPKFKILTDNKICLLKWTTIKKTKVKILATTRIQFKLAYGKMNYNFLKRLDKVKNLIIAYFHINMKNKNSRENKMKNYNF